MAALPRLLAEVDLAQLVMPFPLDEAQAALHAVRAGEVSNAAFGPTPSGT